MKKLLIITNLITVAILGGILFQNHNYKFKINPAYMISQKSLPPCEYQLKYFDFHYKTESRNPKIIMLGNSLIRHGNWDSLLDRNDVINRGISGDHLPCICERLKYLKNSPAKIIFIEGGINDFPGGNTDTLFKYYSQIVEF